MARLIKSFIRGEEGASAAEYALLLAIVASDAYRFVEIATK